MKKRPRRVGFGMKPREGVEAPKESPTEVSAVEVQPEGLVEAVLEGVDGDSEGEGLALESVQNLESKPPEEEIAAENPENEPIVAQTSSFEPVPAVSQEAFDTLEAMMKQSEVLTGTDLKFTAKPIPGREFSDGMSPEQMRNLERSVYEDGKHTFVDVAGVDGVRKVLSLDEAAKMGLPLVDGADTYVIYRDGVGEMWKSDGKIVSKIGEELNLNPVGELPTGEYRATVRLAEGYVEGAKQQAEADGISLEDWLTLQLNAYLEQWWMAPGPR